jgi:hypothetical protein
MVRKGKEALAIMGEKLAWRGWGGKTGQEGRTAKAIRR